VEVDHNGRRDTCLFTEKNEASAQESQCRGGGGLLFAREGKRKDRSSTDHEKSVEEGGVLQIFVQIRRVSASAKKRGARGTVTKKNNLAGRNATGKNREHIQNSELISVLDTPPVRQHFKKKTEEKR